MRPVRIELEGFSAFRHHTVVDFTGADLFAFVGATGAGKSSVIDAMVFALYGSVPRYDSARLVHPVITQGSPEAKVRLDFEVEGVAHTAVRVVRRTRTGATTREARLQRGDDVLAADVASMNAAVESVVGLDLDQFTKCVVLPQGAFASLLHETRKPRQDLLVKLLDLGIYGEVAAAARRRAAGAESRVGALDEQLAGLAHADDAAVAAAAETVAGLERALEQVEDVQAALDGVDEEVATVASSAERRRADRERLDAVTVPDDLGALGDVVLGARADLATAEDDLARLQADLDAAEAARRGLGDVDALRRWQELHGARARCRGRLEEGRPKVAAARDGARAAEVAHDAAEAGHRRAVEDLDRARLADRAADLARHLRSGQPCPVCHQPVTVLPAPRAIDLHTAETAVDEAARAERAARQALDRARAGRDRAEALFDRLGEEHEGLVSALEGAPEAEEVERRLAAVAEADATLDVARRDERVGRRALDAARDVWQRAEQRRVRARQDLDRVRDAVAALGPPPTTDDPVADWAELDRWAASTSAVLAEELRGVEQHLDRLRARGDAHRHRLADVLRRVGIESAVAGSGRSRDAVVDALAARRAERDTLAAARDRRRELAAERRSSAQERDVHEMLARRLHPDAFQKWLLGEALAQLVAGASDRLEELSSGRYGLSLDDDEFVVVDHANADEPRLARSLSGGETFLASLALALALAERVSELSATARSSLDAIFLDEGFGTLDPETLDVVAAAIEELGARGRMVGIVSHVRDLAERVPVRFEVRRGAHGATVERVET